VLNNEWVEEDSISFAVGAKYFFSNRTLLFGGYRQVDSDNDYRDEGVFGVGMRHTF
jgi:predicted porin